MAILIVRQDHKIEEWRQALLTKDSELEVYSYLEPHPKDRIKMAVVWKQPKGSLMGYDNLQCIASAGAGVDFIIDDDTIPVNVPVTRIVDQYLSKDMSEHVLAVILGLQKNLYDYRVDQFEHKWRPKPYVRISDSTVGIMGLGELGAKLAKDLVKFGFTVQGWSNSKKDISKVKSSVGQEELNGFLSTTQILVCLLPLTNHTKGILSKELFKLLPKGSFIINLARGGHLVDDDLIDYLNNNHLAGAALDVFHSEPLPETHPFWRHNKIHMTPHCASVSDSAF
ncbi:MAG: glyoxylate/hydroxypyruvate reductase A, partial [Bacteroidota bacterium]